MSEPSFTSWVRDAAERAVRAAAVTAIASIGAATLLSGVDWVVVADTVGMAVALSVLGSVAARPLGSTRNDASLR